MSDVESAVGMKIDSCHAIAYQLEQGIDNGAIDRGALALWLREVGHTLKYLQSELAAEREAHRWIPVSEKLPDTDGMYLTLNKSMIANQAIYFIGEWLDIDEDNIADDCITHWQPLPEPPKE